MGSTRSSSRPSVKRRLPQEFYLRDTKRVARDLLGKRLVRIHNNTRLAGIIVETEAYLGVKDPAAHTYGGRITERNKVMWGEGGSAYVYFVYGMHFCLNAVTRWAGQPEAVLIRAVQFTEGLDLIKNFREISEEKQLGNGPAKLCQALNITRNLNGVSLVQSDLFIEDGDLIRNSQIICRPRVGIDYAKEAKHWPLRFYIKNNEFISKK